MDYEVLYHRAKAEANLRKHGVSFEEAAGALCDPLALVHPDDAHSENEDRYVLIGESNEDRLLTVCFTIIDDTARIISARRATPAEGRQYMKDRPIRETPDSDDMLPEYGHLEGWKPNPFKFVRLAAFVEIDPDVHSVFRTSKEVNDALRTLLPGKDVEQ